MAQTTTRALRRNVLYAVAALVLIHLVGTLGYRALARHDTSLFDAFYMTFITVATIGYAEIVDMTGNVPARAFTIGIAISGIGALWVIFSNMTALLLARTMDPARQRARLLKEIATMRNHYIVCGVGRIGTAVTHELRLTGHGFVAIEPSQEAADRFLQQDGNAEERVIIGDASDDATLTSAGIAHARGVFAVAGDDARNLLITLSARHLNPSARIVARVHDVRNVEKCRRAGADEIVSPDFTGALRIAAAMLRPQASGFVDELLHRSDAMRVIDIPVPPGFNARPLGDLQLRAHEYLVVGLRSTATAPGGPPGPWLLNPGPETELEPGAALIAIATPAGVRELQQILLGASG